MWVIIMTITQGSFFFFLATFYILSLQSHQLNMALNFKSSTFFFLVSGHNLFFF